MSYPEILFIALALAMDAMTVSMAYGLNAHPHFFRDLRRMAVAFGLFQGGMPWLGYAVGRLGESVLYAVDHWIAFGLLALVGGKMIWESVSSCEEGELSQVQSLQWRRILLLSVATSVDAAAVGVSFSMTQVDMVPASLMIAVVTLILSWLGGRFGRYLGHRVGSRATLVGGLVLMVIGFKILYEHLFMGL